MYSRIYVMLIYVKQKDLKIYISIIFDNEKIAK